jgi:uncharacterized protein YcaQ
VVERLGSLQFDPLSVPGAKNHDLVLHARIKGYTQAWCDGFLYAPRGERRLFEAYNKSLNILPAFIAAFAEALDAYTSFVGAKRVAWPRARIAAGVRRALADIAPPPRAS